jgi:hypothetical protein
MRPCAETNADSHSVCVSCRVLEVFWLTLFVLLPTAAKSETVLVRSHTTVSSHGAHTSCVRHPPGHQRPGQHSHSTAGKTTKVHTEFTLRAFTFLQCSMAPCLSINASVRGSQCGLTWSLCFLMCFRTFVFACVCSLADRYQTRDYACAKQKRWSSHGVHTSCVCQLSGRKRPSQRSSATPHGKQQEFTQSSHFVRSHVCHAPRNRASPSTCPCEETNAV